MIKNIIFDLGEVLLTGDDKWIYEKETRELLGINDVAKLFEGWNAAWPDARDGKISEDEFFNTFLTTLKIEITSETVDKLKQIYRESAAKHLAYPALEKFKGKYNLYSITNITKEWLDYKVKTFELDKYLQVIVSSCWEGIAKPNHEIYQALIKKTGLIPNESVFVDDLRRNIPPANELGFMTIHFKDYEQMDLELGPLGVVLE